MHLDTTQILLIVLIAVVILFRGRPSAPSDAAQYARDARIARIEAEVDLICDALGIERVGSAQPLPSPVPAASAAAVLPPLDNMASWPQQIAMQFQHDLQAGRKIEAIKIYREMTGVGLKDAKDAVEQIIAGTGQNVSARVELRK